MRMRKRIFYEKCKMDVPKKGAKASVYPLTKNREDI
jgi:hypothetical protein